MVTPMPEDALVDFEWKRAGEGNYAWVTPAPEQLVTEKGAILAGTRNPRWLSKPWPLLVEAEGATKIRYRPFREATGLFKEFSETPTTRSGIIAFAERYGPLGQWLDYRDGAKPAKGEPRHRADGVSGWVDEIRDVGNTLRLWTQSFADAQDNARKIVNGKLRELVAPQLEWTRSGASLQLSYAPRNLLGVIWTQVALSLSYEAEYPRCQHCSRPFEVAKGPETGQRSDSIFCSNKCKSADYRARKNQALQLANEKVPLKRIAREVRSDAKTVRRWIKGAPASKRLHRRRTKT